MARINPLNPTLYDRLSRLFGAVKVSSEGEAAVTQKVFDPAAGRMVERDDSRGEGYAVCCPKCGDARFRLMVNHRFGVENDRGWPGLDLVVCYNENCYGKMDGAREDLYDRLNGMGGALAKAVVRKGKTIDFRKVVETLPGIVTPLHKLPRVHPANRYLSANFLDPEKLGRFYGVGYCADANTFLARHRIVVPIHFGGKLKGWQARYIGDVNWKEVGVAKWYTSPHFRKSSMLYNWDNAVKYRTLVIVEGAKDVWAVGPMAAATLGHDFHDTQKRLIAASFKHRSVVLLHDPDTEGDGSAADKLRAEMRGRFKHGFAIVRLPGPASGPGMRDPAEFDRSFVRRFVVAEAAKQGTVVSFEKVRP